MSHVLLAFLVGLSQGLVHALGPDHCAAMATLGTMESGRERGEGNRRLGVLRTALRFALGHAFMLGGVAAVCLAAGLGLSEAFTRWAEVFGGGVLVALAVAALLFPHSASHGHPHLPGHDKEPHAHVHVSTAAGALMAVSGVRALLLALPPLLVGGSLSAAAWSYLPGFALGILVGMGAVGLLFAEGLARVGSRLTPWVHRGVALASGALGLFWMTAQR